MKKNKIFIGLINIGNIHNEFCKAFRKLNIICDSYSWNTVNNIFYTEDESKRLFLFKANSFPFKLSGKIILRIVNKGIKLFHFIRLFYRYNTFIFISPSSFLDNYYDLSILKLFKKKIIYIFTGCVERNPFLDKNDPNYICNNCSDEDLKSYCYCNELNKKRKRIATIEKYSDKIIARTDISSFVQDKNKLIWFNLIIDKPKNNIDYLNKYDVQKIKIVHFPSNPLIKQTHKIKPILDKLKNNNNLEIIIKEEFWSREKILSTLESSHILVNVLGTGYNLLAVEAMARGCVVFNSHPSWFKENVPEAPIVSITAETLEEKLIYYINNRDLLKKYAEKSIEYFNKYHSFKSVENFYKKELSFL